MEAHRNQPAVLQGPFDKVSHPAPRVSIQPAHGPGASNDIPWVLDPVEAAEEISIEINASGSGSSLARLDLTNMSTLEALASSVAQSTAIPVNEQQLVLGTTVLSQMSPKLTLKAAGIINGSRLTLVRVQPPPPPLAFDMMKINDCPNHPYTRCACGFNVANFTLPPGIAKPRRLQSVAKSFNSATTAIKEVISLTSSGYSQGISKAFHSVNHALGLPRNEDAGLSFQSKEALRDSWLMQARGEAVSTLGFEHLHSELIRYRAPDGIVVAAKKAALDEHRHAKICAQLASRFDPQCKDHASPIVHRPLNAFESMEALVSHIALEGCWGETLGALTSATQHRLATDPEIKGLLEAIAAEEFAHCVLSWEAAEWAIRVSGPLVADHFTKTITQVSRATDLKPLVAAGADPVDPSNLASLHQFGILHIETMEEIDRVRGPRLVHELLGQLQAIGLPDERGVTNKTTIDFATLVRSHCERAAEEAHAAIANLPG